MAIHRQAPYIFTKILKVTFAYLRKNGHSPVVYIDDTYLQGDSPDDCERNIHNTAKLLWDLGFSIHPDKSVLLPTQKLEFLGFVLDSKAFIIFLTEKLKQKIHCLFSWLPYSCIARSKVWSTVLSPSRAL